MRDRCSNPKNRAWKNYGGRGITVDPRWNEFTVFLANMGAKPAPEYTLERTNNTRSYSPDNCRWALPTEQANNKRNNRRVTINGRTMTLAQWARETGIDKTTLWNRLAAGWPPERLLAPVQDHHHYVEYDGRTMTLAQALREAANDWWRIVSTAPSGIWSNASG